MKSISKTSLVLACSSPLIPLAAAHGYIKSWSADGKGFQKAQKQSLSDTAFRAAPSNIGWVGSQFINTEAIVCGSSETPGNKVAAPSGTMFHKREQSAKKTLDVQAGGKIELVVASDPGKGFAHHNGHIATYLGFCGTSRIACQDFDASQTDYQKIQAEMDGVSKKLIPNFDASLDGHKWQVTIPKDTPNGSYILRLEIVTFGQSSHQEGSQDQYYPFCGQIAVTGSSATGKLLDGIPTVKFPAAYKPGNIDPHSLPLATASNHDDSFTKTSKKLSKQTQDKVSTQNQNRLSTKTQAKSSNNKKFTCKKSKSKSGSKSEGGATKCGKFCYKIKLEELDSLAANCSAEQLDCQCSTSKFVAAYEKCCKDNCSDDKEAQEAIQDFHGKCDTGANSSNEDEKVTSKKLVAKSFGSDSRAVPKACGGTCFTAKTTDHEIQHLAPPCGNKDLDCLCRSHKWVCAYSACAQDNCHGPEEAEKATDEIYAICGARLASPNRLSLPSTDIIPKNLNPDQKTVSKAKSCFSTCLAKQSSKIKCSPSNLNCVCKTHSNVCAWAKCAEDECGTDPDANRLASDRIYERCSAFTT